MTNKIVLSLIRQKQRSLIYLQFCEYFLRVKAIEVNSLAVSSKELRDLKENEIYAEINYSFPEIAAFDNV